MILAAICRRRISSHRAAEGKLRPRPNPMKGEGVPYNYDMGHAAHFARASMRREADREVREARWDSYSDIGAA
jgi:hypothetical protein